MNESILTSIKKLLGIAEEYTHFDTDIMIHINSVFMDLHQLGVGPEDGYQVDNVADAWNEFVTSDKNLEAVKTYTYLRVKMIFDPPTNGSVLNAYKEQIDKLEWRLNVQAESE